MANPIINNHNFNAYYPVYVQGGNITMAIKTATLEGIQSPPAPAPTRNRNNGKAAHGPAVFRGEQIIDKEADLLTSATLYFTQAAERLGISPDLRAVLHSPERELIVSVPVVRDDGRVEVFKGYRVQHSTAR